MRHQSKKNEASESFLYVTPTQLIIPVSFNPSSAVKKPEDLSKLILPDFILTLQSIPSINTTCHRYNDTGHDDIFRVWSIYKVWEEMHNKSSERDATIQAIWTEAWRRLSQGAARRWRRLGYEERLCAYSGFPM
jgi:hypothetical protein